MPGGHYIALSGMRSRLDELDRLSADIANAGTAGYKTERTTDAQADRPQFAAILRTAIDVMPGGRKLNVAAGPINTTGRDLDCAIEGNGFFVVQTAAGPRYTRNGRFTVSGDGTLVTEDGSPVLGTDGPIRLGSGEVAVEADGTVRTGQSAAGKLAVVEFADPTQLSRESGATFRSATPPTPVANVSIKGGALEESNVSVVERVAELTNVTRSFEALQKALSLMLNDVDARAVEQLGRRA
ncbi:MAG: flagellar hook-basal body protein [Vicinamibacterales bacterium]